MNIEIFHGADGWTSITCNGKTINIRMTRDEFYSKNINITLSSREPTEINHYGDLVYKTVEHDTLTFEPPKSQYKDILKQKQTEKKQYKRLEELKKEAVRNTVKYLVEHQLIQFQVKYQDASNSWGGKYVYSKYRDYKIEEVVATELHEYFTQNKTDNSINLNPTRRKDNFYIDKEKLLQKTDDITNILINHQADFCISELYPHKKYGIDKDIAERIKNESEFIQIERSFK